MRTQATSLNSVGDFNGVLLDMDGTLVNSNAVVEQIFTEFAHEYNLDLEYVLSHAHGLQTLDQIRLFLPDSSKEVHDRIEKEMDLKEVERAEGVVEIPGAIRFVGTLIEQAVPLAIVTSASREVAIARMNAAGVPVPALMITADECPNGKPLADPYLMGAQLIGVPIQRCVAFEDAEAGLESAVSAGAKAVVVGDHQSPLTNGLPQVEDYLGIDVTATNSGYRFLAV